MEESVPGDAGGLGASPSDKSPTTMTTEGKAVVVEEEEGRGARRVSSVSAATPPVPTDGGSAPTTPGVGGGGDKSSSMTDDIANHDGNDYVQCRVAKDFDGEIFLGIVTEYISGGIANAADGDGDDEKEGKTGGGIWHVEYDDGDEEDFEIDDLAAALSLHREVHGSTTPSTTAEKTTNKTTTSSRSKGKQVCKVEGCEKWPQSGNGGMCRRHWTESQTGGDNPEEADSKSDSKKLGEEVTKESGQSLHTYASASDTEDEEADESYEGSDEEKEEPKRNSSRANKFRGSLMEEPPPEEKEEPKRNPSRSNKFQGSLMEDGPPPAEGGSLANDANADDSNRASSSGGAEDGGEKEMDSTAADVDKENVSEALSSPSKSASNGGRSGEQKSPAVRHSTPRRRIKTGKAPVYDDLSFDGSDDSSESGEGDEDEEDDEDELKIERIIASRKESRKKWREICQNMNTSEIDSGSRWYQDDDADGGEANDDDAEEERFLVKWSDLSYLHCSWEKEKDLLSLLKRPKPYFATFGRKSTNGLLFDEDERGDGEYFDAAFVQIERILEITDPVLPSETVKRRLELDGSAKEGDSQESEYGIITDKDHPDYEDGTGRQFLIKWKNIPYSECTYEFERDLIMTDVEYKQEVSAFLSRSKKPSKKEMQEAHKKREEQSRRLYKIFGDKAKLTARMKESQVQGYQTKLEEQEFLNDGKLRDYQAEGVSWLVSNYVNNRSSILADEMGLGKTVQVAAFVNILATESLIRGPFLVVAPLSTIPHWLREFSSWTGLNTFVYHGSADDREVMREYEWAFEADRPQNPKNKNNYLRKCLPSKTKGVKPAAKWQQTWMAQVVITTPEMLVTEDFTELTAVNWEVLVVDEAHRIKNHSSKVAVNLREDKFRFNHKILMTGTPIQNNMNELWSILHVVDPGRFDDVDSFIERYGNMKDKETIDELHEKIRPYILRRLKEDVETSVPPKEETLIEVELTVLQKQYYRALYEKNVQFLHKGRKRALDKPSLNNLGMQLRKCCNHPFLLRGVEDELRKTSAASDSEADFLAKASGKLVLLDKLLPKLRDNGHRVLIFSQFKIMLDILEDYLAHRKFKSERIDGSITGRKRQMAIDRFQAKESSSFIMLLSTRAGGVGINLTAADTCIIFDSDWNPQNDLQAQARCHRIGQTKSVKIYRLLARKTFEMKMFHMSSLKMGLDQAVLQGLEGGSSSGEPTMTKDEVEKLLRHGAYDIFNEEKSGSSEKESNEFESLDIDSIMAQRSKKVVYENTGSKSSAAGGTFSKASFKAVNDGEEGEGGTEDVDIDDPEFWSKIVGEGKDEEKQEDLSGKKRRRTKPIAYSEKEYDRRLNTSLASDDEKRVDAVAGAESVNDESSVSSADINSDGTDDELPGELFEQKEIDNVESEKKRSKKAKTLKTGGTRKKGRNQTTKRIVPVFGITLHRDEHSSFGISLLESQHGHTRKFLVSRASRDLVLGDEIVSVNGKVVRGNAEWNLDRVAKFIRDTPAGQSLKLDVLRPMVAKSNSNSPQAHRPVYPAPAVTNGNPGAIPPYMNPGWMNPVFGLQHPQFMSANGNNQLPSNNVIRPGHGMQHTPSAPANHSLPEEKGSTENEKSATVIYIIHIRRGGGFPSTFGIDFASQSGKHLVHTISAGGAAAFNGRLEVGDEVKSVNGKNVIGTDWKHMLQEIHNTKQGQPLVLAIARKEGNLKPYLRTGTLIRGISLQRDVSTSSFGIEMTGRDGKQAFIHGLSEGEAAAKEGTLKVGDEIVSVNGFDLTFPAWSFEGILNAVRNTPQNQPLTLDVLRREAADKSAESTQQLPQEAAASPTHLPSHSNAMKPDNGNQADAASSSKVPPTTAGTAQPRNRNITLNGDGGALIPGIQIHRDAIDQSFGITLVGLNGKQAFVKEIMEDGPAEEEGTLRNGDEVVSVNGTLVIGRKFEDILRELRDTQPGKPVVLDVWRVGAAPPKKASCQSLSNSNGIQAAPNSSLQVQPTAVAHPPSQNDIGAGLRLLREIKIHRDVNASSFGINLAGRNGKQAVVCGITEAGPAAKEGTLRLGDLLVSVNGAEVIGPAWTFEAVLKAVRSTPIGQPLIIDVLRGSDSGKSMTSLMDGIPPGAVPATPKVAVTPRQSLKARKQADGSIVPVKQPEKNMSGLYPRPPGRPLAGMYWDAARGVWMPISYRPASAAKALKKKSSPKAAAKAPKSSKKTQNKKKSPSDKVMPGKGTKETPKQSIAPASPSPSGRKRSAETPSTSSSKKRGKRCKVEACEKFTQSRCGDMCRRHWFEWLEEVSSRDGKEHTSARVAKYFEGTIFFGTVTEYFSDKDGDGQAYWHVDYDDGDSEDFEMVELAEALLLYKENKERKESAPQTTNIGRELEEEKKESAPQITDIGTELEEEKKDSAPQPTDTGGELESSILERLQDPVETEDVECN